MTSDKETDTKWKKISSILGIISVLLAFMLGYVTYVTPDYSIYLKDISDTRPSNCDVYNTLYIENLHLLKPYNYPIILDAIVVNESNPVSPDINVAFDPLGSNEGAYFTSQVAVKIGHAVRDGRYKIRFLAIGGDGKERSCTYILNIKNAEPI